MTVELVKEYGDQALAHIQNAMEDRWDLLTEPQKSSVERSSKRLVQLDLQKRDGKDVEDDLEFVKTTVNELKLMMEIAVSDIFFEAFWKGVDKALAALSTFLITAGKATLGIPGLDLKGLFDADS